MKRLSADDSADSRVKVGHRQATYSNKAPALQGLWFLQEVSAPRGCCLPFGGCVVRLHAGMLSALGSKDRSDAKKFAKVLDNTVESG